MGENIFFVFSMLPAAELMIAGMVRAGQLPEGATTAWQIGLGVVFYSGVIFLLLSMLGVREKLMDAISPSMRNGIAAGIGLFILTIGLTSAGLLVPHPKTGWKLNPNFASPDLIVFFFGLIVTAALHARRVMGSIFWGMMAATALSIGLKLGLPLLAAHSAASPLGQGSMLMTQFHIAEGVFSAPPSIAPTLLKLDLVHSLYWPMAPFILIFLFMVLFDTLGTLIGLGELAGLIRDNRLPRARQALMSDALGTVAGAALGTSTVTSFVESAAGIEQGGAHRSDGVGGGRAVPAGVVRQPDLRDDRQLPPDYGARPGRRGHDDDAQRRENRLGQLRREPAGAADRRRHPPEFHHRRRDGAGIHRLSGDQAALRPGPRREMAHVPDGRLADRLLRRGAGEDRVICSHVSAQRASGRSRGEECKMQNVRCKMQNAAVSQYKPASHFTIYNLHFAFCILR